MTETSFASARFEDAGLLALGHDHDAVGHAEHFLEIRTDDDDGDALRGRAP